MKYYKVKYLWFPATAGFNVPPTQTAIGSTITHGTTICQAGDDFQRRHPHVQVQSVRLIHKHPAKPTP